MLSVEVHSVVVCSEVLGALCASVYVVWPSVCVHVHHLVYAICISVLFGCASGAACGVDCPMCCSKGLLYCQLSSVHVVCPCVCMHAVSTFVMTLTDCIVTVEIVYTLHASHV